MTDDHPLPLDRYPQIVFGGVTRYQVTPHQNQDGVTRPVSQQNDGGVTIAAVTPKCLMCGRKIGLSAKTCSPNCRKAASRRKDSIKRSVQDVKDALALLERYSDQWPDLYWEIMQAIGQCGIAASSVSRRVAPKGDNR